MEVPEYFEIKEAILSNYGLVWLAKVSSKFPIILYLDCYAGPGKTKSGNDGSPIRILKEILKVKNFQTHNHENRKYIIIFLEKEREVFLQLKENTNEFLRENRRKFRNDSIYLYNSDFHDKFKEIINLLEVGKNYPSFVFLDPYNCDIPFSYIKKLIKYPKVEILMNFFVSGFIRNFRYEKKYKKILDFTYNDLPENFSEVDVVTKYISKIKAIKSDINIIPFTMKNKKNTTLYHLLHFSRHNHSLYLMKSIMQKLSTNTSNYFINGFIYSPTKYPDKFKLKLFNLAYENFEKKTIWLLDAMKKSGHEKVLVNEIFSYYNTDQFYYSEKNIRDYLKQMEEEKLIIFDIKKLHGEKRRKGTYPPDSIILLN